MVEIMLTTFYIYDKEKSYSLFKITPTEVCS